MAYWYARTAPEEVFEVEYVKTYLSVTDSSQDDIIRDFITVARRWAERYLGAGITTHEIEEYLDEFPVGRELQFSVGNMVTLNTLTYRDSTNTVRNFMTEYNGDFDYHASPQNPSKMWLTDPNVDWPRDVLLAPNQITMIYEVGTVVDAVDPRVKEAMLLQIQYWHRNRGDMAVGSTAFPELRSAQRILDQCARVRI